MYQSSKIKSKSPIQSDSLEQGKIVAEQAWKLEFSEDFSGVDIGAEPENIFILDGEYTVQKDRSDNKCLTLPGTPMGDLPTFFSDPGEENLGIKSYFFATKKGRRMPLIAASIEVRGYRLRLNSRG